MATTSLTKVAVVCCTGGDRAKRRTEASTLGLDCRRAAEAFSEGLLECTQGCLGLGTCVDVCPLEAIHIGPHGAALVDRERCVGCGVCVQACPRKVIRLVDASTTILPRCSNQDAGPTARKVCEVSCITCRICEKNCPADAISMVDNHAMIDPEKCASCGMCAVKCPRGVIVDADGMFTVSDFSY